MLLDRVTVTGADDNVDPEALAELSQEFPFVEWGILFSASRMGTPRYPTHSWVQRLTRTPGLRLSAHLCGLYTREPLWWLPATPIDTTAFQRVQFNSKNLTFDPFVLKQSHAFIVQCFAANLSLFRQARNIGLPLSPLFDRSGGRGVTPAVWPHPWAHTYCGYAGGLNPSNVLDEVLRIDQAVDTVDRGLRAWIDMETGVRTYNQFDLSKVRQVLSSIAPYVV